MRKALLALLLVLAPVCASAQNLVIVQLPPAPRVLTSASVTTCTNLIAGAFGLFWIENANAAAQTVTLTLFDDVGACASANVRGTYILGQGQVITWAGGKSFNAGLSYTLSSALNSGGPVLIEASK